MSVVGTIASATDPITALMVAGLGWYVRQTRRDLGNRLDRLRGRVSRVEGAHIPDGGEPVDADERADEPSEVAA